MKIFVHAKPNAKENSVDPVDATHYVVSVTTPPVRSQANLAIIELLAEYFHLPKSLITITKGATTKNKTVIIETNEQLI